MFQNGRENLNVKSRVKVVSVNNSLHLCVCVAVCILACVVTGCILLDEVLELLRCMYKTVHITRHYVWFVTGLELAYIYAPRSMQGIIMALYWFSQGVGSLVGLATIQWFESVWFTPFDFGNINCHTYTEAQHLCHLDYYFCFVAGLQVVGIAVFVAVTWGLGVGRPVPLRIQRQGHTLVRPANSPNLSSGNNGSVDLSRIANVRPRAFNNRQSLER